MDKLNEICTILGLLNNTSKNYKHFSIQIYYNHEGFIMFEHYNGEDVLFAFDDINNCYTQLIEYARQNGVNM